MAWSFLGKRAKGFGSASSIELARPEGAEAGCLLVACVYLNSAATVSESNFSKRQDELFATNERWVVLDKVDDGSQKFTIKMSASGNCEAFLLAFSGNGSSPYDTSSIRKTSAGKTFLTTSINVAKASSLLLNLTTDSTGFVLTPPAGMTEIVEHGESSTFGMHVAWGEVAAGATGEKNFSGASSNENASAVLASYKPPEEEAEPVDLSGSGSLEAGGTASIEAIPPEAEPVDFSGSASLEVGGSASLRIRSVFSGVANLGVGGAAALVVRRLLSGSAGLEVGGTAELEIPGEEAPPPRVAVSREYPPDQLAWRIDPPNGAPARWAADEPHNENVATGIQLSEQMPGGETTAICTLSRNPRQPWPDLAAFSPVSVYGPGVEEVWGGRLDKAPENDGDRMVINPEAVGNQAYLEDDAAIIGPGFIDGDMTKWEGPTASRKVTSTAKLNQSAQVQLLPAGTEDGVGAALSHSWTHLDAPEDFAESWYRGEVPLQYIALDFANVKGVGGGAWFDGVIATSDDTATVYEVLHNFNATTAGPVTFVISYDWKRVVLQSRYEEEFDADGVWDHQWRNVKLFGKHGLALQGTWPQVGFTASQMLGFAVPQYTELTANAEDLEDTGYIIQQAWYADPSTMKAVVEDICKYDLFDWWVDGQKRFHLKAPGSYGREWLAYAGPSGLSEAGLDSSRLWKSIVVSFQDVDGTTKTVGPPGSGATFTNANLELTDPDHPAVRAGITRQDLLSLSTIATESAAVKVGERFLEEANQLSSSGSATLSGYAMDSKGVLRPVSQLRAGDRVRFPDASDVSARRVVGKSYDHATRTVSVDLGAPPEGLRSLLARMDADIQALQLS